MKKVTIYVLPLIIFLSGVFYSCNGFEDQDLEVQPTGLTEEAQQLKELYQTEFLKISELKESRSANDILDKEVQQMLLEVAEPTVRMFKSYGFTDEDWKEYEGIQDLRFIYSGMLFLAVADRNTSFQSFPFMKSRSVENNSQKDCWTFDDVIDCIIKSIELDDLSDLSELAGLLYGCMAKDMAYKTIKQFLKKFLPPTVSLGIIIIKFAICMSEV